MVRTVGRGRIAAALCFTIGVSAGCSQTAAVPRSAPRDCSAISTFADRRTPDHVRHVAVNGSDRAGDGSAANPFQTLTGAASDLAPGTAIYLHAGTYPGGITLTGIRGTADAPIWIAGAPGEARPVISGGGDGLHFVKPRYVIIEDLEIRESAGNGMNIDDGDDVANVEAARFVVVRNITIDDVGLHPSGIADCLKLAGVNELAVLHRAFRRCGRGQFSGAVGVGGVGVHDATIAFNRFAEDGFGAVQFKGGSGDVDIYGNVVQAAGARGVNMGGRTSAQFFRPPLAPSQANYEAAHIRTRSNVFVGGETAAAFTGCVACEFTHNTVIDPEKWVVRILQETVTLGPYSFAPASDGRIVDNIFYFRRADVNTGEDINIGAGTYPASFSIDRNLWYAHDAPRQSEPRMRGVGPDTNSLVGIDPMFVNATAHDFHLGGTSIAIAGGGLTDAPPADVDGKCYDSPPSLGALR
jgi:hypothetical protein